MKLEVGFIQGNIRAAVLFSLLSVFAGRSVAATNALIGWSETGLHEMDGTDFSVYCLAPPYNTIHAQLVSGGMLVTNPVGFTVTYQATADGNGSLNSTSVGKGNFYQYARQLFGISLSPDQGL